MSFLSPLFLIGLLSAVIPLIIHLSRSRRTKKMRFSTTRFFTDQFLRSYHMSRLKELLLLACRMAVCALLAVALARPLLLPKGQSFLVRGSRAVVLVMDNSASMGYREDGLTMLDRARGAAKDLIDGLGSNDSVTVVLAGRKADGPEVLFPEPTRDRDEVRKKIEALDVAALGTDLTGAVAKAEEIARSRTEASKEVYVLSDLQDSGWELKNQETAPKGESEVLFFFVRVRPKRVSNLAITGVKYGAARPMIGVPYSIRPVIASQGEQARAGSVRLFVDGEKVGNQPLDRLEDGRWVWPLFHHTFASAGWHQGYVEVEDEGLPQDNRRYFAVKVLDSVKVLGVNGSPSEVPRLDEFYFLKAALTASPEGKPSPVQFDTVSPAKLSSANLGDYPLVILANVEKLSADAVEKLEAYVDRGGSLLVFLGDKVDPAFYNQNLTGATRLNGGLLPGRLVGLKGNPAAAGYFAHVSEVDYGHPALSLFGKVSLGNVAFKAIWGIDPDPDRTSVLMQARASGDKDKAGADSRFPLLCERAFGKGRVMLFASTCDLDWTNFPGAGANAFLPWAHRLVAYLAEEPMGRQPFYITGDRVPLPVAATEGLPQVQIKKPDGGTGYAVRTGDADFPFAFTDTAQPGVYGIMTNDQDNAQQFAVNLDGYESNLTYLDDVLADWKETPPNPDRTAKIESGFKKLMGGRQLITYVDDPTRVNDISLAARHGIKLWDFVLGIVLVLALFEPWLANRISARHYARPKDVAAATVPLGARALQRSVPETPAPQEVRS